MTAHAGTRALVRHILRRDRVRLPVWIVAIVGLVLSSSASYTSGALFTTDAEVAARNEMITANPAAIVVTGPGYGYEAVSLENMGPMVANEMSAMTLVLVAIMCILLAVRHTRSEEEAGRTDLVRSAVVGRFATPFATLVVLSGANVVMALLLALGLASLGLPLAGSFAFGIGVGSVGIVFAAIAVLTAQLAEFARGATGLALAAMGVLFAIRGIGDITQPALSWLSPFGWAQSMRPYAGEVWWPPILSVALALAAVAIALAIIGRRDVGAGIVRPRPGPAAASSFLGHPLGLALRLQRGSLVVWGIVLAMMGLVVAGVVTQADQLMRMEAIRRVFLQGEGDVVDSIFGTYLMFMALLAMAYALLAAGQLRGEETSGRAEPVLATATSRLRWASSHLAVVLFGTVLVLGLGGLTAGTMHAANVGDAGQLPRIVGLALTWVPATLVFVGLSVAIFGLWPRGMALAWVLYAYGALTTMFGPLLQLPEWVDDLSPIGQTPLAPGVDVDLPRLAVLAGIAAALVAVGLLGFGRRDLQSPA